MSVCAWFKPDAPVARFAREFKTRPRAWWSFCLFMLVFILSLGAEFIANDQPLLVRYHGELYSPVLKTYPETAFGGDFATATDYRDPYIAGKILEDGWMVWPMVTYSFATINYDLPRPAPTPPDHVNLLGTDDQGRDVLARILYGFRISVLFALALTASAAVIGVILGVVQGFLGGLTDLLLQRFTEIWSGMPELFLLMILASIITPNFFWLLLILLLFSWMGVGHVVRAETLRVRNFDYVTAARVLGVSELRVMLRHVLPNALTAALTMFPFMLSSGVTVLTTLDFLGFGFPPGSPSLGELLLQGKNNPHAPWLGLAGFCSIAVMLTLLIFIAEGVRDTLDPRKSRKIAL